MPFTSCVTMGKLLSPSVPPFSHLENGDDSCKNTYDVKLKRASLWKEVKTVPDGF